MSSILETLKEKVLDAMEAAYGEAIKGCDPAVTASTDSRFGHYQCNAAMGLAKRLGKKPREIAGELVNALQLEEMCLPVEVAGPGFINIKLRPEFITGQLRSCLIQERLGVGREKDPKRIVVDFSSPNIAKELHVGHLRSTIIGDCLARVLEFLGHTVIRQNHVGDWGTQFGMLIAHLKEVCPEALAGEGDYNLGDIVEFYREAKKRFDEDPAFSNRSRDEVVKLQSGEGEATRAWKMLCRQSRKEFEQIYQQLDVKIEEKGESYYNPFIPEMLGELDQQGLIEISDGAKVVWLDGFTNKEGEPLPLIVQKRDGGYNYDTTDMTTIRYRARELSADKILYVTDAGQSQHFQMLFAAAKKAGWLKHTGAIHVPFGMVLGEDQKKLKTRSGDTVPLRDLLDEAVRRARTVVDQKNPGLSEKLREEIAEVIGLAAIKYADLSHNRISNYVFSFDKMLALNGNTAPYLIYAYVRIQSIARKGNLDYGHLDGDLLQTLETPEEIDLGLHLLRFPEAISGVARELLPNRLTDYLYELAQQYSRFYTNNKVLGDPRESTRLVLCSLTARTLKLGLSLLGMKVIEEM